MMPVKRAPKRPHSDLPAEVPLIPHRKHPKRAAKKAAESPEMKPLAQPAKEAKQRKRKAVQTVMDDEELRAEISEKVVSKRAKKAAAPDVQPCKPAPKTRKRKAGP